MGEGNRNYLEKGGTAYLAETRAVRKVTIISCSGGLYKVRFEEGGGTCVKAHRLFATPEEAEQSRTMSPLGYRPPHI